MFKQQGQIIISGCRGCNRSAPLGVNVSYKTAGAVEKAKEGVRERKRESRKQQVRDKVARPVNMSGFHSRRQNSRKWMSSMTKWTGDSQESSGEVVLRYEPRAQILREGREIKRESELGEREGAY